MKPLAALFLLAIPFGPIAVLAGLLAPVAAMFYGCSEYAKGILRSLDRLGAAVFGFSGRYTVSAECGASDCAVCRLLCRFLDLIQPGHCAGAARNEGRAAG